MQMLVRRNEGYIMQTVMRHAIHDPQGFDDLKQEAYSGLVEAVRHFDPQRGVGFLTYAHSWILKRVIESVRDRISGGIRITGYTRAKLKQEDASLLTRLSPLSLESTIGKSDDEKSPRLGDTISDACDVPKSVSDSILAEEVRNAVAELPDWRMRYVLTRYYGLDGDRGSSLSELGTLLGISSSYVEKILKKASSILRKDPRLCSPAM